MPDPVGLDPRSSIRRGYLYFPRIRIACLVGFSADCTNEEAWFKNLPRGQDSQAVGLFLTYLVDQISRGGAAKNFYQCLLPPWWDADDIEAAYIVLKL